MGMFCFIYIKALFTPIKACKYICFHGLHFHKLLLINPSALCIHDPYSDQCHFVYSGLQVCSKLDNFQIKSKPFSAREAKNMRVLITSEKRNYLSFLPKLILIIIVTTKSCPHNRGNWAPGRGYLVVGGGWGGGGGLGGIVYIFRPPRA